MAGRSDHFQTPGYAIHPLIPYLYRMGAHTAVWDCAAGFGNLVNELNANGIQAFGTDTTHPNASRLNFLRDYPPVVAFDVIVTNPPYSKKDAFVRRCLEIGKPFALLMPLTALEGKERQACWKELGAGFELLIPNRRVNFETPSGQGSGSWFPTAWFCGRLNIGRQITFVTM